MTSNRSFPIPRALTAIFIFVATLFAGIQIANGARDAKIFGQKAPAPRPACPNKADEQGNPFYKQCQVQGQVTVFQRTVQGRDGLYKARSNGRLVAWSISLGKPTKNEQKTLLKYGGTEEFPDTATAGLSVLKPQGEKKFKLTAKSPIMRVDNDFGREQTFTLDRPLRIRKGEIAALTTATYLPFLGIKQPHEQAPLQGAHRYVASRKSENCRIPDRVIEADSTGDKARKWYFKHTNPHREVGSTKAYECEYNGERLMYKAYFVPNRSGNN